MGNFYPFGGYCSCELLKAAEYLLAASDEYHIGLIRLHGATAPFIISSGALSRPSASTIISCLPTVPPLAATFNF
jgi:hypothetical protein